MYLRATSPTWDRSGGDSELQDRIEIKEACRSRTRGKNWLVKYKDYIGEWDRRYESCVKEAAPGEFLPIITIFNLFTDSSQYIW